MTTEAMIWKEYLNQITSDLATQLEKDIQYSSIPKSQIRQIAWREIEMFLEEYKKWSPEQLILNEKEEVSIKDSRILAGFLEKRKKGLPLAYILGKQRFYGMDFEVNKNTLIPRPETEELISHVINKLKGTGRSPVPTEINIIDVGTGSGCILTVILKNLPENINVSKVYAIDESKNALEIARKNVRKYLKNKHKIKFIQGSLLSLIKLQPTQKYFIISNLPYLSKAEYKKLSPEVKKYEPKMAFIGGENGSELICKLIDQVVEAHIEFDLFLEISPTVYPHIKKHLAKQDVSLKTKVIRDLSGKIRFLSIRS